MLVIVLLPTIVIVITCMATRYATEITLSGNIITDEGMANQGMAIDYSEVKRITKDVLINKSGHAFLAYLGNIQILQFLQSVKNHKTAILNKPLQQRIWH